MPRNDERPTSTSSGEDQGSDVDSTSEHLDSRASTSDLESSRHSFTSDGCSSKNSTPSSSPPKPITLDEVMASAKELSNLSLAHEIIVNRSFHLETNQLPQNSLEKLVKDAVHKAFWDILEAELNADPPQYEYAIKQLEDIRETLLSFLNPGANRMRTQIMEVLDMDLIRQQADNDALDIQGHASYIVTTMGKMCAPARDDEVRKLREITGIVTQFKEIFRVLDLMKLDMVNFTLENMRPELLKQAVEYERAKFQNVVDLIPGALDHTTSWIRSAVEELVETMNKATNQTNSQGKGQKAMPGPFLVIDTAFLHVLTWDHHSRPLPETLMTDEMRLQEIQWQLQQLQTVNQVLLIVYSAIGGPIQGLSSLADRLKRMTSVLLDGMNRPDFNLEEALEGASTQICCELNKSLTERKYPSLTPALQASLSGQICSLTQKDNPIRTLVEERVQQYFMGLIAAPNPKAKLEQVPAGLTAIQPELASLGAKFIGLVNYNKRVYGPFYSGILRKLMFSDPSPTPCAAQEDPTPSNVVSN